MIRSLFAKKIPLLLFTAYFLAVVATLVQGEIPWNEVWEDLVSRWQSDPPAWNPLWDDRLPRLLVLSFTGASLPVAGIIMQSIFRNPLASPSILGVSSGASLSALFAFIFGWKSLSPCILPLACVGGAFIALLCVYKLGRFHTSHAFILAGMAISTLITAGQDFLLHALRNERDLLQTLAEWQSGFSGNANWQHVYMQFPLTSLGLAGCWLYRREIDLFSFGEEHAAALGVDVVRTRWHLFICVALLTGSSIAVLGIIPFLGLILPHTMRLIHRPTAKELIPWSAFGGAFLLVGIDLFLRYYQFQYVSLGNLTALIGGFFFLYLLLNQSAYPSL
ncbi:iron ABC transporter permease [Parachlamydia sp. AcF125]|uniref:FecCD family ABC transporter permease n=1 Tax=Parachlamydia sp. AcF125 TaxID=2795736 RepID=UPI001BC97D60|nr:iron ABC transporter permease [Parachlamydia sp. AcF125]MBS4169018.1 Fe(3+) dicitrate transport system permease protein FecD [Parachlamydia sp. AcF125]